MGTHPIFESDFDCLTEMSDNDDEEYDVKLDSPKRDSSDPKPLLQERKETEKRTSSPSVKKDKQERPRYQVGETLWCYDGPDLYPAKCMKLEHDGKMYSYLIHYNGWSKTYDEWMYDDDSRLACAPRSGRSSPSTRSKTPSPIKIEGEKREKTLAKPSPLVLGDATSAVKPKAEKQAKTTKEKVAKAKTNRQKVKKAAVLPKPRRPNAATEYQKRFVLRVVLPECLKDVLQDDHDFITKQQKIIPIPATPTAADIFAEFGGDDFEPFFNKVLSSKLLYKFERPMFADFLRQFRNDQVDTDAQRYPNEAPPPARVYGFAHLVRYVYHLDQVLFDVDTDFAHVHTTINSLQRFVDFLAAKCAQLHLPTNYHETAPAYHRRAQS